MERLGRFIASFAPALIGMLAVMAEVRAQDHTAVPAPLPAFADLPEGIASFGAAIDGDWLYVYGGHTGRTHTYSRGQSSARFQRINLKTGGDWEALPAGPGLQGLALVAHEGQIYRIGGMSARNEAGQPDDLYSLADFARFDPRTKTWAELAPLPEGRSSHGAAIIGGKLYVVGGWHLEGAIKDARWHDQAIVLDLAAEKPVWESLPAPPFQRRALAVTTCAGKLYAAGGLLAKGGISKEVDVFDPGSRSWAKGPEIPGMAMNGNGIASCGTEGALYLSGMDGKVYRQNKANDGWDVAGRLERSRIHHRLMPVGGGIMLAVAGATMSGNLKSVDAVMPGERR